MASTPFKYVKRHGAAHKYLESNASMCSENATRSTPVHHSPQRLDRAPCPSFSSSLGGTLSSYWQNLHGKKGPQFVCSDSVLQNIEGTDVMIEKPYFLCVQPGWDAYSSPFNSTKYFSRHCSSNPPMYTTGTLICCCNHLFVKRVRKRQRLLWDQEWQERKTQIFENLMKTYADLQSRCEGKFIVCFLGIDDDWFLRGEHDHEGTYEERWNRYIAETMAFTLLNNVKAVWLPATCEKKTSEYEKWLQVTGQPESDNEFAGRKYSRLECRDGYHPIPAMKHRFCFLFDLLNRMVHNWPDDIVTDLMAWSASPPSPPDMHAIGDETKISTVHGMLTIVCVTVSELNSVRPWNQLRTNSCKSILHAAYTSRVTKDECLGKCMEQCLPQFHCVEETESGVAEFWELCKETAHASEAVAIVNANGTGKSMLYNLLLKQAAKELHEMATCLESEYGMPQSEKIVQQRSLVCKTCDRNLQNLHRCWECGRMECKHCAFWCTMCPSGPDKYTICSYCVRPGIYLEKKGKIWTCRKCQILARTKDDCNNKHACVKRLHATPENHLERNASKAAKHAKAQ